MHYIFSDTFLFLFTLIKDIKIYKRYINIIQEVCIFHVPLLVIIYLKKPQNLLYIPTLYPYFKSLLIHLLLLNHLLLFSPLLLLLLYFPFSTSPLISLFSLLLNFSHYQLLLFPLFDAILLPNFLNPISFDNPS